MQKQTLSILSACAALSMLLSGCSAKAEGTQEMGKVVDVVQAEQQTYHVGLQYLGVVQPRETKKYSFLAAGKLAEVYVEKGQEVHAGDPLVKLDTTQAEATAEMSANNTAIARDSAQSLTSALNASQASLDTLRENVSRYQTLSEMGAVSETEMETLQNQLIAQEAAHAQLQASLRIANKSAQNSRILQQQAEKALSDATLTADADGVVMELPFQVGESVLPSIPVVVTKSGDLVVSVGVSIEDYGEISKDSAVVINGSVPGSISTISAYPNSQTRLYTVEITFDSAELAVGDTVDILISTGSEPGYSVPVESVFQVDGLDYVFVVDENHRLVRRQVTLGEPTGSSVRVTGLSPEALIVASGVRQLRENDLVLIAGEELPAESPEPSESAAEPEEQA